MTAERDESLPTTQDEDAEFTEFMAMSPAARAAEVRALRARVALLPALREQVELLRARVALLPALREQVATLREREATLREREATLREREATLREARRPTEDTAIRAVVMSPEMALARRVGVRSCVAEYARMKHLYSMR